MYNTVFISGR